MSATNESLVFVKLNPKQKSCEIVSVELLLGQFGSPAEIELDALFRSDMVAAGGLKELSPLAISKMLNLFMIGFWYFELQKHFSPLPKEPKTGEAEKTYFDTGKGFCGH